MPGPGRQGGVLTEKEWDSLLKIQTTGRDDSKADQYRYPYEPTPYPVLERLAGSGLIGKRNLLLDYGCGKGRVDFFLAWQRRCKCIGVDYDTRMIRTAMVNRYKAVSGIRTEFFLTAAEDYQIPDKVDRIYFFNPFSVQILHKVLARIRDSWYECPRQIFLFVYYPSSGFISALMAQDFLEFQDEIDCTDLFEGNDDRERIMIFSTPVLIEEGLRRGFDSFRPAFI